MKRIIFVFFIALAALFLAGPVSAESDKVTIHFFEDKLCPVCRDQKEFLEELKKDYPQIELKKYSISDTARLGELAEERGIEDYRIMAPTTFVGDNFFQFSDFTERHEEMLVRAIEGETVQEEGLVIGVPFSEREVDVSLWSLPALTAVLGSLDGFNVCSLGALILILSIVLAFESRKKIFIFGGLFILVTGIVYGLLVFVWGRLFEVLVGQLDILRLVVGLAALGGGVYFFREFLKFYKHGPACSSSGSKLVREATKKLQQAFKEPQKGFVFLATSVALFAVVITIVELPCSVGIPIAFTGILVERGVSLFTFVLYVLAYIFFYLLMEIIIFTGAVMTKKIWFAGSKMITWTTFGGAVILLYLAFYYLSAFWGGGL